MVAETKAWLLIHFGGVFGYDLLRTGKIDEEFYRELHLGTPEGSPYSHELEVMDHSST